jgi:hypothetical protein
MSEEIRHPDGRVEHPSVHHEPTDANFRWIATILLAGVGFGVVSLCVILVAYNKYRQHQEEIKRSPFPLAPTPSTALPPEPRLEQVDRAVGINNPSVAAEERLLESYGPAPEAGYAEIPIAEAMKRLAGKLPVRAGGPDQDKRANGLVDAGEPNSGRLFREKP